MSTAAILDNQRDQSEPELAPIKKVSIICSKGALDMAYPGLILANAARMSGIEATLFFTFCVVCSMLGNAFDSLFAKHANGV